jgi:hypothetical protein
LLHWKTSPSSNWSVMVPIGSSWIEWPWNLLFKLLSPQHFHPQPSQWQARVVGWSLTFLVSPSRPRSAYLQWIQSPLSLVKHVLAIYKVSSWTNLEKLLITALTFAKVSWSKSTRAETWDWPFLKRNEHPCQENLPHKSHQAVDWKVYRYDPLLRSMLRQQMLLCTKSS